MQNIFCQSLFWQNWPKTCWWTVFSQRAASFPLKQSVTTHPFLVFLFCGKILKWWSLSFPFHFVVILSSCILLCSWSGLRVCIQSYIIAQRTCSIWLSHRNLITCNELRAFVCGFGGQGLELVFSQLASTDCPSAFRTWNVLVSKRWEGQVLRAWGRGLAICIVFRCTAAWCWSQPHPLFEVSLTNVCSSVLGEITKTQLGTCCSILIWEVTHQLIPSLQWKSKFSTVNKWKGSLTWDCIQMRIWKLYIHFHMREKLLNPAVWRGAVKTDSELVVLALSSLPAPREAGEWCWQAVLSSETAAEWDRGDSCEQVALKRCHMLDSGEPSWCSCH